MTIAHVTSPTTLAVMKALEILFAYMTCFRIIHLNWLSKHRRLCHTDAWQMLGYFTLSLTLTFSAKRCSAWFFNQFSSLAINMELNQNAVCMCAESEFREYLPGVLVPSHFNILKCTMENYCRFWHRVMQTIMNMSIRKIRWAHSKTYEKLMRRSNKRWVMRNDVSQIAYNLNRQNDQSTIYPANFTKDFYQQSLTIGYKS